MPDELLLGLGATDDPSRYTLHVHPGITTGSGARVGGAGLGGAVTAMAKTTGRPLVFATGQFLRHGATGTTLDLRVEVGVRGHKVTQAHAVLSGGGEEVMRVVGAFGSRDFGTDRTFATPPRVPSADACPLRTDLILQDVEARRALGRDLSELDGTPGPGRSASWFRMPGGRRAITPGEIAFISDCSSLEVSDALGFHCVNASLDNTLRMASPAESDWILLDTRISNVIRGFATVQSHLWAENGVLLAVFSQTLVVRESDEKGLPRRTTKRYSGSPARD